MLVYVNQFELLGENSPDEAFTLVSKWLSKSFGQKISKSFLKSGREKELNSYHIRTFVADELSPKLYSILFTHPDKNVSGRQWISEIGIKVENNKTLISILLEISDVSTRVKEPPKTTKPNLVALLHNSNVLDYQTIGFKAKKLKNNLNEFKGLDYEINRKERAYPLILVSRKRHSNEFIISPTKLQEQLLGLAQVWFFDEKTDLYELEKVIGKHCVWDGAIRIIYPLRIKNTRLFRSAELTKLKRESDNIYHEFLSFITHISNGFNKRKHFKPTDVRAKRNRDKISLLKDKIQDNSDYEKLAIEAFNELDKQEEEFKQKNNELEQDIENLELSKLELEEKIKSLEYENSKLKNKVTYNPKIKQNTKELGLIKVGKEQDLYTDEIQDLLINIIESYYKGRDDFDKNDREYIILDDVISHNSKSNYANDLINKLKTIFTNYSSMNNKMKNELTKIGLEVVESGEHNKLKFINDDRFIATFAKSASDTRVSKNIINHIKKALFNKFA